ncbi:MULTISPECIES: SDR family oxidoreductase [Mesorhizobium]|uniref:Short-chain dehydrogenase/reductase n=2 Tax=Mesorhizobium TaxID=68287 RepID=A0A1A5JED8_RHILI|nr:MULTISPECIES: SDR family oxidoreductase [Mesorhizobium]MBE1710828.1 SDR family oxidoreductase [Mesorhizobium japonicum]MBE1716906.1 SDR family oxidoreductase [Mesorhizobium japonicum]MUT25564.1 SDR family oxidoreductase [Mesorhizobium japonicum]MUT31635.1 SDR family oxidoreductase [Mesorhizobium japonicum]OBP69411.1 short-chain dehydrogenase/reductase [Mesorhizobium loti]
MTKTWFITGASSGFGRQLTELLLERGDRVAATVRKPDALHDLATKYGERLWVGILDVTDSSAVRDIVGKAFAELKRIDVVVSNAGYALFGAAEEVADAQIERQIDTNLVGSISVARAVIPHLRQQGGGRIVQISSSVGQSAYPTMGVYAATKWGIEGFYEGTIPEIAPFGIEVTLVEPGASRTNFASSSADAGQILDVYDQTPVGDFRRLVASAGLAMFPGDPRKVASAIIASAEQTPAPRRLTLGSDAYALVHTALTERLAALESQKALARSTDVDA